MLGRDLIFMIWNLMCLVLAIIIYVEHGNTIQVLESMLTLIISIPVVFTLLIIPEIFFPKSHLTKAFQTRLFQ